MRVIFVALLAVLSCFAFSVEAGNLSITDGRVTWLPTKCQQPREPAVLSRNPEAAANDLNALVADQNRFAEEARAYMSCVSQEAQTDAEVSSQGIVKSAQDHIQRMQSMVVESANRITNSRQQTPRQ